MIECVRVIEVMVLKDGLIGVDGVRVVVEDRNGGFEGCVMGMF